MKEKLVRTIRPIVHIGRSMIVLQVLGWLYHVQTSLHGGDSHTAMVPLPNVYCMQYLTLQASGSEASRLQCSRLQALRFKAQTPRLPCCRSPGSEAARLPCSRRQAPRFPDSRCQGYIAGSGYCHYHAAIAD